MQKNINNCELLNYIYKNTSLIIIKIEAIIKKINNRKIKILLYKNKKEYLNIIFECKNLIKKCNGVKENIGLVDRLSNKIEYLLKNSTDEELIRKLYISNLEMCERINNFVRAYNNSEASSEVLILKLKNTILKNNKHLKKYL